MRFENDTVASDTRKTTARLLAAEKTTKAF